MSQYDVLTIGNAIVDIIAECDDAFLVEHGIIKGAMNLVDAERSALLYSHMGPAIEASGGCAGNTAAGDGCRANCTLENVCGDSLIDSAEQCDDGNTNPGDGCDASCQLEAAGCVTNDDCGPGYVCFAGTCYEQPS